MPDSPTMLLTAFLFVMALGTLSDAEAADPPFIDTQVGPVRLADEASGRSFVMRFGGEELGLDFGFATFRYANAAKTQVLDLLVHPGGTRYHFMQVLLRPARGSEPEATPVSEYDSFSTGRGVYLGLRMAEVIQLLGEPQDQSDDPPEHTLVYRCNSSAVCPILKQVNMPQYEGRYVFRAGRLVRCEWGYPYP